MSTRAGRDMRAAIAGEELAGLGRTLGAGDLASLTLDAIREGVETRRISDAAIRVLDVTFSVALIVLLGWLFLIIALAIRLDSPGAAIFRQARMGRGGRVFTVYKFRTMCRRAEERVHAAYERAGVGIGTHHAAYMGAEGTNGECGRLYKLISEQITRVGRLLRRTSLDELPQLFNVVRGDMSLVGPRPVVVYEVERYPEWYLERFRVKPGLTGLWQVNGRDRLSYEQMVSLDIEYATQRSIRLYLSILVRTLPAVAFRRETV